MAALPWKDEYNVNVAVMDRQHRRLAELVSKLGAALQAKGARSQASEVLSELIAFTRLHFATEEELMLKYAYPDYQAHQAEHKVVLGQMNKLADQLAQDSGISFDTQADISQDWVTKHLLERDVPLGRFLNKKGIV
jgi:hemerythrin-like metal-binding protein